MNLKEPKAIRNALLIFSGSLSGKSLEETMQWAQALLKSRLPQHIVQCAVNLEPSCSVEEGIRLAHFLNLRELSTATWAYSQAKALLNGKQTFFDHLLLVADSFYSHSKLPLGVIIKAVKKAMESSNELSKIKADVDQIIKDACQMAQAKAQHILGAGSELEQLGTLFILKYGHKATGKFLSLVQEARDGFQPVENQLSLKERVEILLYIKMHRGEWERELENDPPESFFHISRTTSELVRSLSYQKGGERIIIRKREIGLLERERPLASKKATILSRKKKSPSERSSISEKKAPEPINRSCSNSRESMPQTLLDTSTPGRVRLLMPKEMFGIRTLGSCLFMNKLSSPI